MGGPSPGWSDAVRWPQEMEIRNRTVNHAQLTLSEDLHGIHPGGPNCGHERGK